MIDEIKDRYRLLKAFELIKYDMKQLILSCLLAFAVGNISAQDIGLHQMISNAAIQSRTPEGDRSYYGLWARDKVLYTPYKMKTKWESPEDSIRKRGEFVTLCSKAFLAYDDKDALATVVYGDSALRTGFDNAELYFYMAYSFETLGDYRQAERSFKAARSRGFPNARLALSAFKKRMKQREKGDSEGKQ